MANPFLNLMTQTVSWEHHTGINAYGAVTYASPATVACRWRKGPTRVQTDTGVMIVATDVLWAPPDTGIEADDRITLPDTRVVFAKAVEEAPDHHGVIPAQRVACL